MSNRPRPTVHALTQYLASFFPVKPRDVPFEYHIPRVHGPPIFVDRLILSVTPTEGVYNALHQSSRIPPMAFLHRPFDLDRKRVRRGSTILSSHVAFDEVLTVGWNVALAARLGVVGDVACIQGYKNDVDRKIGLVGHVHISAAGLALAIATEFHSTEAEFGIDNRNIKILAIMNAFHPDEVQRVLDSVREKGWEADGPDILYLTGAVREPGLEAAVGKGMSVICVGHRTCEEWGIRYLASQTRSQFPNIAVEEIFEAEEPRIQRPSPVSV